MKPLVFSILALVPGLLVGQDAEKSATKTQSWSGLLVAAGCQTSAHTKKIPATDDMPRSSPTAAGQQNATYEQQQNQADRTKARDHMNATDVVTTPKVDSVDTRGSAPLDGNTMATNDQTVPSALDSSCRISEQTNAFALRLNDGSLLRFDTSSNAKIAQQVQTGDRLKHKTKIFRAKVHGTLEGEAIRADSIKM